MSPRTGRAPCANPYLWSLRSPPSKAAEIVDRAVMKGSKRGIEGPIGQEGCAESSHRFVVTAHEECARRRILSVEREVVLRQRWKRELERLIVRERERYRNM
eukprot:2590884-Rhodomonas_salina.1